MLNSNLKLERSQIDQPLPLKKGLILILFFLLFQSTECFAETGFGVDKTIIETLVKHKEISTGTITAINNSDDVLDVEIQMENWLKKRGFTNELSKIDTTEWLKIEPINFKLRPYSAKKLNYQIKVPEKIEGELVAMAFFVPKNKKKKSSIQRRLGVCIYAAIENNIKVDCKIKNTRVVKNEKYYRFIFDMENSGNVHIRPSGEIVIMKEEKPVKVLTIKGGIPVFPGKTKFFLKDLKPSELPLGVYTVQAEMKYGESFNKPETIKGKIIEFISME